MSGCAISSAMLAAFTDPPYWMRTAARRVGAGRARPPSARIARAHRLGVVGAWPCGRADGPDRLVGDRPCAATCSALQPGERRPATWPSTFASVAARLALLERLADAQDRRHAVAQDRRATFWSTISSVSPNSSRRSGGRRSRSARRAWPGTPATPRR